MSGNIKVTDRRLVRFDTLRPKDFFEVEGYLGVKAYLNDATIQGLRVTAFSVNTCQPMHVAADAMVLPAVVEIVRKG